MRDFTTTRRVSDASSMQKASKRNKFNASTCEYKGIRFASYKERDRFIFLSGMERSGVIHNLRRQVTYELFPDEYKEEVVHLKTKDKVVRRRSYIGVTYTADFVYEKNGVDVVEDVKGSRKVVTRDAELRFKMMHYLRGIDVRLVFNATEAV